MEATRISIYQHAQVINTGTEARYCSSLFYMPKTTEAEIAARPGFRVEVDVMCGRVGVCVLGLRPTKAGSRGIDWLC